MIIETTLNMRVDILQKINEASECLGKSNSDIIISLLKIVMEKDLNKSQIYRAVKYQDSCSKDCWKKFHIKFRFDEYEFFFDLRKFLKMSLSLIVAYAVKKYLNDLIKKKVTDNYNFKNYIFNTDVKNGYRYFQIIWGYPPNIEEYYPKIL